jgi:GNAT superfamily N-acetyltransferase
MLGGRGKRRLSSGFIRTMSGEPAHAGFYFLVNLQMRAHRSEVELGLEIFTLRERPDLRPAIFLPDLQSVWPEFMRHGTTAELYFAPSQFEAYLDYAFAGVVDGKVVARAFSVPFAFNVDGRDELPDGGWDQVIRWAHEDRMIGRASTALSALEITLVPEARGSGNSIALLNAMKCCARANGYKALFAPVRPNQKHLRPHTSMREYISEMRADGLPADPWLRIHLRAGGRVVKIAPYSMTIIGSIADWSTWTGATLDQSGEVAVAGGLAPLIVSLEQGYAVYVEPNVWVEHVL